MMLNALPMWRKKCGSHAMQELRDRLLSGPSIHLLFPEGKRSRDGSMNPFKPGLGMMIAGAPVPVVPCFIDGAFHAFRPETPMIVGRGYRTNAEGIRQVRTMLGADVEVVEVPLPHWRGPGDVMHLMSLLSPVDHDLAVVYSRLLPVPFREWLLSRGFSLVEVPDEEFDSMGTNVLALSPRRCVMLAGNPRTRAALERAGCEVLEYQGDEISVKGAGGPTCLTRPLARGA
jgi:N-dimethylarginine dimethylaminohydrolase